MPETSSNTGIKPAVSPKEPRFRSRLRLRQRGVIGGPTTRVSRRLAANYLRLFNKHVQDSLSLDHLLPAGHKRPASELEDSFVLGIHWTADEKEQFFSSLARRGKRNVELLVHDLRGTKSVLEVSGYLHALERELQKCVEYASRSRFPTVSAAGLLAYHQLPIAHEISGASLTRESVFAEHIAEKGDAQDARLESRIGWSRIDASTAAEIETELATMTAPQLDIMYRTTPDLVTISASRVCQGTVGSTYKSTMEAAYRIMVQKTRLVVRKSIQSAQLRTRSERGSYFTPDRFRSNATISVSDVLHGCAQAQLFPESRNDEIDSESECEQNVTDNEVTVSEQGAEEEQDVQSEIGEEETSLDALLDLHDTRLDARYDIEHRRFLGLLPSNRPSPKAMTRRDVTRLSRQDWALRQVQYHEDENEDEMDL
ncbi:RNA polymerase I-specific transcription initiation factor rrn5 [Taphrina deformans PYCC 5710]|uniref:RNA polymerase I-specific transcription initiation factor rrn5 n=1 Tax=Taphrina deformans (strain PYCC 5710 / ATCC 11124 / CBS 356.35 / IMI 108563 / JCM 9778 / NBRC 8474) TaxID=1097556 RepID=R4XFT3_TAPDE|nr:RNA polymerase I-specific transcription initiation factor rrn5 [Taphrina deformans PYCC 5710]|eukprot:CCG83354.1 RNA polymerase I-specific transcription initiation factor rrn5 [Taphrina deformans PYCC 5710]